MKYVEMSVVAFCVFLCLIHYAPPVHAIQCYHCAWNNGGDENCKALDGKRPNTTMECSTEYTHCKAVTMVNSDQEMMLAVRDCSSTADLVAASKWESFQDLPPTLGICFEFETPAGVTAKICTCDENLCNVDFGASVAVTNASVAVTKAGVAVTKASVAVSSAGILGPPAVIFSTLLAVILIHFRY